MLRNATLALILALAFVPTVTPSPVALPICQEEDGNIDGSRCLWTDPETGAVFTVDSRNYR